MTYMMMKTCDTHNLNTLQNIEKCTFYAQCDVTVDHPT